MSEKNAAAEGPSSDLQSRQGLRGFVQRNCAIISIMLAVVMGVALGIGIREFDPSSDVILWIGLPGELYMRMLKALIVPLLICLIYNTAASINPKDSGRIALFAVTSFFANHLTGSLLSVCLFFAFRSDRRDSQGSQEIKAPLVVSDVFADLFRNLLPDNIVTATFSQTVTKYEAKTVQMEALNGTFDNMTSVEVMEKSLGSSNGANILGLLCIFTAIGMASQKILPQNSPFRRFFHDGQKVMVVVMEWSFWTTPIAVLSLIMSSMAKIPNTADMFQSMGRLTAAVSLGLAIQAFVIFPALLFFFKRRNPFPVIAKSAKALAVGFASTSSAVALPPMMAYLNECGVHPKLSNVVYPMGLSLHKPGSNLFMTLSALFIGQMTGTLDSVGTIVVIVTLCSLLSMMVPSIPSAAIMTLVLILSSVNVPVNNAAMLFALEWLLDRLRTTTNLVGHLTVIMEVDTLFGPRLRHNDVTRDLEQGQGHQEEVEEETGIVTSENML